jgi:preprotein translocase subunit SecD
MNTYPAWKYLLVLFFLVVGIVYSMPNLYPPDAAVQISASSSAQQLDQALLDNIVAALKEKSIAVKGAEQTDRNLLVRLSDKEQQLAAKEIIEQVLKHQYVVALNLAPTTPQWLMSIGAEPMKLGLDLSGGVHFLLEVDTDFALQKRLDGYKGEVKKALREQRIRGIVEDDGLLLEAKFKTAELRDKAEAVLKDKTDQLSLEKVERDGSFYLHYTFGDALKQKVANEAVAQNLTALRNRVNELGVSEPLVQRQGANRIVVELPGVQDSATAKRIIGKTASLEFRLEADGKGGKEVFDFRDAGRRSQASLERTVVITGDQVSTASSSFDENGRPQVNITLDSQGGRQMHQATKSNIGRNLGVLFIERKHRNKRVVAEDGTVSNERVPYYQKEVISLATIQSALGVQFRITGLDSPQESKDLALLLRAGALAAPIDFVEERTIGPSLGAENIALGVRAVILGMALVLLFMLVYYKVFGFVANIALLLNIFLLVAIMSIISATLTLPGIAGIVLTVGMAVDANVLIFARIREELADGLTPQQAISAGYDRAFSTIMDANITTLLVAMILYAIGTGPVKGFAVTLAIGIITSMFTAIVGTRAIINLIYGNRNITKLAI